MTFDFFPDEQVRNLQRMADNPSPGPDQGFWSGAGGALARGSAIAAKGVANVGFGGLGVGVDALTGGYKQQENVFSLTDSLFNPTIKKYTPDARTSNVAGQIVGGLVPQLGLAMLSPELAVAANVAGTSQDLVDQGVPVSKAIGAGVVQGTGLALGLRIPVLGSTLPTRIALGAASNVVQGAVTDAATHIILKGTEAGAQYNPWSLEGRAIDLLLGAGFGGLAHLGGHAERVDDFRKKISETDKDAILVANQVRHMEDTTAPGIPADAVSQTVHVDALKSAIDSVLRGEPVNVEAMGRDAQFVPDQAKAADRAEIQGEIERHLSGGEPPITTPARDIGAPLEDRVNNDFDALRKEYEALPETEGGRVIGVDLARELSPDYRANRGRAGEVYDAAQAFIRKYYAARLAEIKPGEEVEFSAGGTGAGKSSAIGSLANEEAKVSFDSTLRDFGDAQQKIDSALDRGAHVTVNYVYRDPMEAFTQGVLPRAMTEGRPVTVRMHAASHPGSNQTVARLIQHYVGDDRVQFHVVDNSRGYGKQQLVESMDDLPRPDYNDLERKLHETLNDELEAGRISPEVHRGVQGALPGAGRAHGGEPQRDRVDAGGNPPEPGSPGGQARREGQTPLHVDNGGATPLQLEARQRLAEQPDLKVPVLDENGNPKLDADGNVVTMPASDALDAAERELEQAQREAPTLFQTAAACLIGRIS